MWANLIQSMWSEMMIVTVDSIRFAMKSVRRADSPTGRVQERDDTLYHVLFELLEGRVGRLKNGEISPFKERCPDCGHDEFEVPTGDPNGDTDAL